MYQIWKQFGPRKSRFLNDSHSGHSESQWLNIVNLFFRLGECSPLSHVHGQYCIFIASYWCIINLFRITVLPLCLGFLALWQKFFFFTWFNLKCCSAWQYNATHICLHVCQKFCRYFISFRDPNKPNPLSVEWPKFTTESGQFLELKTGNVRVIDTPNKERNALLLSHLFSARRRQIPLDLPDAAGKKGIS